MSTDSMPLPSEVMGKIMTPFSPEFQDERSSDPFECALHYLTLHPGGDIDCYRVVAEVLENEMTFRDTGLLVLRYERMKAAWGVVQMAIWYPEYLVAGGTDLLPRTTPHGLGRARRRKLAPEEITDIWLRVGARQIAIIDNWRLRMYAMVHPKREMPAQEWAAEMKSRLVQPPEPQRARLPSGRKRSLRELQ